MGGAQVRVWEAFSVPHSPAAGQGFRTSSARALGVPGSPAHHPEALLRLRGPSFVSHPSGLSRTLALALMGAQALPTPSVWTVALPCIGGRRPLVSRTHV